MFKVIKGDQPFISQLVDHHREWVPYQGLVVSGAHLWP